MEPLLTSEAIEYYYDNPQDFVYDNIIVPAKKVIPDIALTPHQKDGLNELAKSNRISIESGHGTGKSTMFAWAGMWFLTTRHNTLGYLTKIPAVAPTFHQLYDILWPEFRRWIPLSRLSPLFGIKMDEIYMVGHKDSSFIRARSPNKPDNVQGFHATHLMWIIDEAFGITDELIWETIEGSLTEDDNKIIMAGQHTTIVGYVHDAFNKDREFWSNLRFNSEESPIAKQEYCARIARKYGKDSDIYRVRVKGMAPKGNPESFIQLEQVERAKVRKVPVGKKIRMGVDCARFGDDLTTVTTAAGNHVFPQKSLQRSTTQDTVDLVLSELRKYRKMTNIQATCDIKVDSTGGYGAGVIDKLNENTEDNIRVVPINFSGAGDEEYHDIISKMWGEVRDIIEYIQLPECDFLTEELATRRFKIDSKQKIRIEPKIEFKKEYGSSPDRSDSLILCLMEKSEPQRVWPLYNSTNSTYRRNFKIEWKKVNDEEVSIFVVLVAQKDHSIYINFYFWGRRSKTLRVFEEIVYVTPIAENIGYQIRKRLPERENSLIKVDRYLGNSEMFKKGGRDIVYYLKKNGVRVKENLNYNEAGSILLVNNMFANKQIVIHSSLSETDHQLRTWRVENDKPIKGFPLCESLCTIVSTLKEQGELSSERILKPYSQAKQNIRKRLQQYQAGSPVEDVQTGNSEYDYLTK